VRPARTRRHTLPHTRPPCFPQRAASTTGLWTDSVPALCPCRPSFMANCQQVFADIASLRYWPRVGSFLLRAQKRPGVPRVAAAGARKLNPQYARPVGAIVAHRGAGYKVFPVVNRRRNPQGGDHRSRPAPELRPAGCRRDSDSVWASSAQPACEPMAGAAEIQLATSPVYRLCLLRGFGETQTLSGRLLGEPLRTLRGARRGRRGRSRPLRRPAPRGSRRPPRCRGSRTRAGRDGRPPRGGGRPPAAATRCAA